MGEKMRAGLFEQTPGGNIVLLRDDVFRKFYVQGENK
jgi:hypothetical protein